MRPGNPAGGFQLGLNPSAVAKGLCLAASDLLLETHRGNLMRKMGVRVVADLVKLAERAGVGSTQDLR